jgi:uridine nucleosidase
MNGSNAILAMREALLAQPLKTAWPVATELLTNAALLFATFQELVDHVSGLNTIEAMVRCDSLRPKMVRQMEVLKKDANEKFGNEIDWPKVDIYCKRL